MHYMSVQVVTCHQRLRTWRTSAAAAAGRIYPHYTSSYHTKILPYTRTILRQAVPKGQCQAQHPQCKATAAAHSYSSRSLLTPGSKQAGTTVRPAGSASPSTYQLTRLWLQQVRHVNSSAPLCDIHPTDCTLSHSHAVSPSS
jgi:hypothetical protein